MKHTLLPDKDYKTFLFDHRSGGNGFAVIQDIPEHPEYCRVVSAAQKGTDNASIGDRAFVAWRPLLTKSQLFVKEGVPTVDEGIGQKLMRLVEPLREKLSSGQLRIVNSRFVAAD